MPITWTTRDSIAFLTIEGSDEHNALVPEMYSEFQSCLVAIDTEPQVRAVVLRGAGDEHFSCGADVAHTGPDAEPLLVDGWLHTQSALERHWYPRLDQPVTEWVARRKLVDYRTTKPIVAAIRGECLGSALVMIGLHSDLRIAAPSARFGFNDVGRGLGGSSAVMSRLYGQIPSPWLMWMIEAGQNLDAQTALQCGLLNEIVPDGDLVRRATEVAAMCAALPPERVRLEKLALQHLETVPYEDAVVLVAGLSALVRATRDRVPASD